MSSSHLIVCECSNCRGKKAYPRRRLKAHMERDSEDLLALKNTSENKNLIAQYTDHIRRVNSTLLQVENQRKRKPRAKQLQVDEDDKMDITDDDRDPGSGADEVTVGYEDKELEAEESTPYEHPQEDSYGPSDVLPDINRYAPDYVELYIEDIDSTSEISEESVPDTFEDNTGDPDDENNLDPDEDNIDYQDHLPGNRPNEFFGEKPPPEPVINLKNELRGEYTCPKECPAGHIHPRPLNEAEEISLAHYIGWWRTNSTVKAYDYYRHLIGNTSGHSIYSLQEVRRLAERVVQFHVVMMDMCPMSCTAYTGEYAGLSRCPYEVKSNHPCNEKRYHERPGAAGRVKISPHKQFAVLPVMPRIRALFADETTSRDMRTRDTCLKEALSLVGQATLFYKDFPDSQVHIAHHTRMNLFKDKRDVAFALSSDGAQLTMKCQSNTWVAILILLNLPPHIRYKSENVIINLVIPGPHSPQNLDSFLYPLFKEMAKASEGIWVWDAIDSSYFVLRAYITMVLGDMLGSAKLNGMAGHTAVHGDRFTLVRGAKTSEKNSKRIYYPLRPPQSELYNKGRPLYDFDDLPMRTQDHYYETIVQLQNAKTETQRKELVQQTGISRMTLCSASPAFRHPSFFPFDPFHLFYENCMAFIWDLWMTMTSAKDGVVIGKSRLQKVGEYLPPAMTTLPPAFCGPIRDVYLKRQSQYKIYEWMALLHWYLVPMLLETNVDYTVIANFAQFVEIIEYSMTIIGRSEKDLSWLHSKIKCFLEDYERLYVNNNPANISRCRLCIFQLIQIPYHIRWNGSVRLGSQATVERSIGELGHRIRSRKAPFSNLIRLVKEKELVKILQLRYPRLTELATSPAKDCKSRPEGIQMISRQPPSPKKNLYGNTAHGKLNAELDAIKNWLGSSNNLLERYERWGKLKLLNGYVLRSVLLEAPESEDPNKRHYRWFKARGQNVYGEAFAFYRITVRGETKELVVYHSLIEIKPFFNVAVRGLWSQELRVMEVSQIVNIVGIWRVPNTNSGRIYVLQKHPGLEMLELHVPHETEAQFDREDLDDAEIEE